MGASQPITRGIFSPLNNRRPFVFSIRIPAVFLSRLEREIAAKKGFVSVFVFEHSVELCKRHPQLTPRRRGESEN